MGQIASLLVIIGGLGLVSTSTLVACSSSETQILALQMVVLEGQPGFAGDPRLSIGIDRSLREFADSWATPTGNGLR